MQVSVAATETNVLAFSAEENAEQAIQLEMNAKAFSALSDGLYKNKIGSIVREIASNCLDAHIQAGHPDRPFEIHLPDSFQPYIAFKDYGVGLSPEDMKTVYTKFDVILPFRFTFTKICASK